MDQLAPAAADAAAAWKLPAAPRRASGAGRLVGAAVSMDVSGGLALVALPLAALRMGASPLAIGALVLVHRLLYVALSPIFGRLADRVGSKALVAPAAFAVAVVFAGLGWADRLWHLFALMPLVGLSTAVFWPAMQRWMGEQRHGTDLYRIVGVFNIGWSAGNMAGSVLAGVLFGWNPHAPFAAAAVAGAVVVALVTGVRAERVGAAAGALDGEEQPPPTSPPGSGAPLASAAGPPGAAPRYLLAGWCANFGAFFALGAAANHFPALARSLAIGPATIGVLVGCIGLARTLGFIGYALARGWAYRMNHVLVLQVFCLIGLLMLTRAERLVPLAAAFLALGVLLAGTYASSLYYSLDLAEKAGTNSGLHESILVAGLTAGALLGGAAAEAWGLRAPFWLALFVVGASALIAVGLVGRPGMSPFFRPMPGRGSSDLRHP